MQRLQRRLSKLDLTIKRHVHDDDKMFGSVTAKNIAQKLEKSDMKIEEKDVLLEAPIKVSLARFSLPTCTPCCVPSHLPSHARPTMHFAVTEIVYGERRSLAPMRLSCDCRVATNFQSNSTSSSGNDADLLALKEQRRQWGGDSGEEAVGRRRCDGEETVGRDFICSIFARVQDLYSCEGVGVGELGWHIVRVKIYESVKRK